MMACMIHKVGADMGRNMALRWKVLNLRYHYMR